jgi:ankyrin repeat protein
MDDQSPPPPTQLLAALWDDDRATALLLVVAGVDPNVADSRDIGQAWTPLHFAADVGDRELVRALVAAGAEVDARSVAGQTPLWWACNNGHLATAQELLSAGADPNARSTEGYSPLGRVLGSNTALMELVRSYGGVV